MGSCPTHTAADQAEAAFAARLLGIPSRQAGSALSLPISRALSSARSDLFLIQRSGWSFPGRARWVVSPFRGLLGYQWSRGLWVTVARTVCFRLDRRSCSAPARCRVEAR